MPSQTIGARQFVAVITSGRFLLNKQEASEAGTCTVTAAEAAPAITANAYRVPFQVPDTMAPVVCAVPCVVGTSWSLPFMWGNRGTEAGWVA